MVVVITSTGGVTKRVIPFEEPLDRGLVDWAAAYLNEALGGLDVGSRMLHGKLDRPRARAGASATFLAPARAGLHRARGQRRATRSSTTARRG